jgi:hypothetical protein
VASITSSARAAIRAPGRRGRANTVATG